jgi:glycogen synthase
MGTNKRNKEMLKMTAEMKTVEKIRASYAQKKMTKFDELKELDKKVKLPAEVFAYVFGSVSSLVLGTGMCLAMKVIGTSLTFAMPLGICVGLLGILGVSVNYSIYKNLLTKRKQKYAEKIFVLSDELLNN